MPGSVISIISIAQVPCSMLRTDPDYDVLPSLLSPLIAQLKVDRWTGRCPMSCMAYTVYLHMQYTVSLYAYAMLFLLTIFDI